jgi:hypothetical protein
MPQPWKSEHQHPCRFSSFSPFSFKGNPQLSQFVRFFHDVFQSSVIALDSVKGDFPLACPGAATDSNLGWLMEGEIDIMRQVWPPRSKLVFLGLWARGKSPKVSVLEAESSRRQHGTKNFAEK